MTTKKKHSPYRHLVARWAVLAYLDDHADGEGLVVATQQQIAETVHRSPSQVRLVLRTLRAEGIIEPAPVRRIAGRRGASPSHIRFHRALAGEI